MGSPMWSYENMLREADRIFTHSKKEDEEISIEDLEVRIKSYEHDNEFFFECGVVAANILNDMPVDNGYRDIDSCIIGLGMFKDLIGIEDNELAKIYQKSIPKMVLNRKSILDFHGNPYTFQGDCPICGYEALTKNSNYCPCCGQKLEWEFDEKSVSSEE